jgi:hypothetical protein
VPQTLLANQQLRRQTSCTTKQKLATQNYRQLDPEDWSLWKMTRQVMRIPSPSAPPVIPGALASLDYEKSEALVDSLEAQFQQVNHPSVTAAIEVVNEAMQAYSFAPACEAKLSNPTDVQDTIRGLKFGTAPGPDNVPNRTMKHLPISVISIIIMLFKAIFLTQYILAA